MYEIKGIYYSGRKGARFEPINGVKYDGLVGCFIVWDKNGIIQFEPTYFTVYGHDFYTTWRTGPVIQLTQQDSKTYELETVNTIYILEDLG